MRRIQAVLFDLDGTLLDTAPDMVNALNALREEQGEKPLPYETVRVAYAMSKEATHALMRHVATRFGKEGIRANVIAPGVITHPRFEQVMPPEVKQAMKSRIPVGRLGEAADIAPAFIYSYPRTPCDIRRPPSLRALG